MEPIAKAGPIVRVSGEMRSTLGSFAENLERLMGIGLWRWSDGWRGWPTQVVLFPRLERAADPVRRALSWVDALGGRALAAGRAARDSWHGLFEDDDW